LTTWHRFLGRAVDGRFHPSEPQSLKAVLRGLEGKALEVAVRVARRERTLPQNKKLHVLAGLIAKVQGETKLHVKRWATLEALGVEVAKSDQFEYQGRTVIDIRGTSDLTIAECSAVMEVLLKQAAFLEIPEPDWNRIEVMD
jgi:hypothetical protein